MHMKTTIFKKGVILVVGIFLLSGCTLKLMYEYADWVLPWVIDDYFDLTAEQDEFLDQKIKQQLAWHKMSELPMYAQFLKEIKQKGEDGLIATELDWVYGRVDHLRKNIVRQLSSDTADFLANLTKQQIQYLEVQLLEYNESAQERLAMPVEERKQERAERTLEFLEEWVGTLSEEQKTQITQWSLALPDSLERRIQFRKQRQQEFVALLKNNHTAQTIEAHLLQWYLDIEAGYPPEYRKFLESRRLVVSEMILKIDQLLTPEQRQHAIGKIEALIADIEEILSATNTNASL